MRLRRESWGFALGSALFALGALPGYGQAVGARWDNLTYFVGSLFFTAAGLIQFRLSGRPVPGAESHRIERYDWWSALIQFVGTLLFNVSTFAAVLANLDAEQANRWVWRPDIWGSLAFLISSGLAVVATTDTDRLWDPHARNWRTTWLNMLGSVAFGVSARGGLGGPFVGDGRECADREPRHIRRRDLLPRRRVAGQAACAAALIVSPFRLPITSLWPPACVDHELVAARPVLITSLWPLAGADHELVAAGRVDHAELAVYLGVSAARGSVSRLRRRRGHVR